MPLSSAQLSAVLEAKKILVDVDLTTTNLDDSDFLEVRPVVSQALSATSSLSAIQGSLYHSPPARAFTAEEIQHDFNCINRQTYVHALLEHPVGAIVEYPETGATAGVRIAHRFSVDPANFSHPKENFQYSLGDSRGGEPYVYCGLLLLGSNGSPTSCKGLQYCSARALSPRLTPLALDSLAEAEKEIFFKTLGFYCTLAEKGCGFDLRADGADVGFTGLTDGDDDLDPESSSECCESNTETSTKIIQDSRRRKPSPFARAAWNCDSMNTFLRVRNRCQYRTKTDTAHLILRTLDEFDIPYLRELLENDSQGIHEREELARQFGYGPRSPCSFAASPSAMKTLCSHWHRSASGTLARGQLQREPKNCAATFDVYTPYDLLDCPRVVIICRSPHSHPNPHPLKTPPPLMEVFRSLLLELDWKLADATPRKLMLDSGFMASFRRVLAWNRPFDPPLATLHSSLGNLDHVRRCIDELRDLLFPSGTGFEGAQLLAEQHSKLPADEQYVRCAETHILEDGKPFQLIICMLQSMSSFLMRSKKLSLDTAFKRLSGKWQEFEMETWELDNMKSVIGTRAFTTSQSAEAHVILFTRIFEIAFGDTGLPCRFRHIHGKGFELWITDSHKGQALGAGMFCQNVFFDCTTHIKRNVDELRPYITPQVRSAMLSLSSSQVHPNIDEAFRTIENGGPWLKDKWVGSKFALPALYQPASLIPLEIWKSPPSTTNGNEQAHRNINRDGVNLTVLGGLMRGMQYDARAMGTLELHSSQGVYSRDQTATHFRRLQRSLNRHVVVQKRIAASNTLAQEDIDSHASQSASQAVESVAHFNAPNTCDAAGINASQAAYQRPLFTTTPLPPAHLHQSDPPSSWLDEQMAEIHAKDVGYLAGQYPQFDFGPPSSDGYTDNSARTVNYFATYSLPPFDLRASHISPPDENVSHLHIPSSNNQLPHPPPNTILEYLHP
ncbi:hypothetical protein C8J57DRAFT_1531331 [Mycena rebaudengoi]|nr:hypothetical protein C8J57DRAFT_1531331 [Mycena rebaudengoi]